MRVLLAFGLGGTALLADFVVWEDLSTSLSVSSDNTIIVALVVCQTRYIFSIQLDLELKLVLQTDL